MALTGSLESPIALETGIQTLGESHFQREHTNQKLNQNEKYPNVGHQELRMQKRRVQSPQEWAETIFPWGLYSTHHLALSSDFTHHPCDLCLFRETVTHVGNRVQIFFVFVSLRA